MADGLRRLGLALSGFGAGVQGRGGEFRESLQRQSLLEQQQAQQRQARGQELARGRREAAARNFREINDLIRGGLTNQAISRVNERLRVGSLLPDFDPASTQFVKAGLDAQFDPTLTEEERAERLRETTAFLDIADRAAAEEGLIPMRDRPEEFTLSPGELRFRGGEEIARVDPVTEPARAPTALLAGLPPDTSSRAQAAFEAAGGGSAGINALNEEVSRGTELRRREEVPSILDRSFPSASAAERAQLEAAVDGAANLDDGLELASKIREEQRRLSKAQGFQVRAVELLDNILASDALNSVIGPIEGRTPGLRGVTADVIADIDEAQNILTAENMDLMTGVLSESDIKLLKNLSSGALNRTRSEARFRRDAQRLRDKLSSQLVETVNDLAEQQAVFDPIPAGPNDQEGQTAVNPTTGQRIVVRDGMWVPE